MKSRTLFYVCVFAWALHLAFCSLQQEARASELSGADEVSVTATVTAIDYVNREVTLTGPDGEAVAVYVDEDAYNFDQIEVGDLVDIVYRESVIINLEKMAGDLSAEAKTGVVKAATGQKPRAEVYSEVEVKARVEHIDYENRTVDIRGPHGRVMTIEVDESVENFDAIKAGDDVVARYTEAVAISVRPAGK